MRSKNTLRGAALVLLLALSLSLFACSSMSPIKSREGELDVVGKIGRFDVYYEELRYITVNCKKDMEIIYGESIWDDAEKAALYRDELYERVEKGIASDYYGVLALADILYSAGGGADAMLASSDIKKSVQTTIDETVTESGGKKEYRAALEENAMTDHLYRFYTTVEKIANELFFIGIYAFG